MSVAVGTEADRQIIQLLEEIQGGGGGGGGGMTQLSDDTTPELGGTLNFNGHGALYALKFRIKTDGSFQLYNPDTSKYHTISLSGADGAVTIDIAAGEA